MWEESYDPNGGEYEVPKVIYDVIGGGPYGGATLLPENGMGNSEMADKFKYNPKSGLPGRATAGIVVGVFVGIALVISGILWHLKRSKVRARGTDLPEVNSTSLVEMSTMLSPKELHSYTHAQELHAYMPNEMASTNDEGHTGTSHYGDHSRTE